MVTVIILILTSLILASIFLEKFIYAIGDLMAKLLSRSLMEKAGLMWVIHQIFQMFME